MKVPLILFQRERKSAHIMATLHYERRQRALRDAFILCEQILFEDKPIIHVNLPVKRKVRTKKNVTGEQLLLFDQQTMDDLKWIRGPKLRKRFVSQLTIRDIGKIHLVMGILIKVELKGKVAVLTVVEKNQSITIRFGEAFIEEPFNHQYLNQFYILQSYIGKVFTGVGAIQSSNEVGKLQCFIQYGTDFRVDNLNLVEIVYIG